MSEDSTRVSSTVSTQRERNRTHPAQIVPFPPRQPAVEVAEPDHITITLMADGTHSVRMVGQYAEAIELAAEALGLALDHVEPLIVSRAGQIINFPVRRLA